LIPLRKRVQTVNRPIEKKLREAAAKIKCHLSFEVFTVYFSEAVVKVGVHVTL